MARPPESNLPLPLTTLELAVAGGGAATPAAAFQNAWARLSNGGTGPASLLTWDLLNVENGRGQYGSFKFLLSDALRVNGIVMDPVTIFNVDGDKFRVKSWVFGGADLTYASYNWPVVLQSEPGGSLGMGSPACRLEIWPDC